MPTPRKFPALVSSVTRHTVGVYTVELRPQTAVPPFRAGQFLHLALDPYDPSGPWPDSRVFSIATPPRAREVLRITYSVKGTFTGRMARELRKGLSVWIKMPFGSFNFEVEPGRDMVLIAGGTGITPFISFLEQAWYEDCRSPIWLFYGIRRPEYLIYEETVLRCQRRLPGFQYQLYVEEYDERVAGALRGRVDADRIVRTAGSVRAVYYLSGPLPMIRALRSALRQEGIGDGRIRVDDWE